MKRRFAIVEYSLPSPDGNTVTDGNRSQFCIILKILFYLRADFLMMLQGNVHVLCIKFTAKINEFLFDSSIKLNSVINSISNALHMNFQWS